MKGEGWRVKGKNPSPFTLHPEPMKIDINSDIGESFGRYTLGFDVKIMPLISSANIACGLHAGDPVVMRQPRAGRRRDQASCSSRKHTVGTLRAVQTSPMRRQPRTWDPYHAMAAATLTEPLWL